MCKEAGLSGGQKSPSGVQVQIPSEADANLLMNA